MALLCFITLGSFVIAMFGPLVSSEARALNSLDPQQITATVNEWMSQADALSSKLNLSDQTPTGFLTNQIQYKRLKSKKALFQLYPIDHYH